MRSLRMSMAAVCLAGIAPAVASAQQLPAAQDLLKLAPTLKGVEYDIPAGANVAACKVETVVDPVRKVTIGYALRDSQGKLLRRFVISRGSPSMDQWSYYQDGFEVYRETDLNKDQSPDEARWLNNAGTRIATVAGGKITGWKRISAEEASKVFVQALVSGDGELAATVFAKPDELAALGVPKAEVDRVSEAATQRAANLNSLLRTLGQSGWTKQTVWSRLDGMMPHLIPADPANGVPQDITLYENAVIFAAPPTGQGNPAKMAFLQAPDMIKLGETWKFLDLPRAIDPEKPIIASEGGLRAILARVDTPSGGEKDPKLDAALKALAEYNKVNTPLLTKNDKREIAQFHVGLIPLLRDVVKIAKDPEEKLVYNKQIADSLAASAQTGYFPKGFELLDGLAAEGGSIAPYATFRKISAHFALKNERGDNPLANQKEWMADLKEFIAKYSNSAETPEALFQLAQGQEFNAEEADARKFYTEITQKFGSSDYGKKAAGALRRLDLVGTKLVLRGPGLDGQEISTAQYKGKTLLVFFWASWAGPIKTDLPELTKLSQKYKDKGFEILGINLDNERASLDTFLKTNPFPWPQIFEENGMDSRLSTEFGIISLPTMFLVDPQGNVVNRSIRSASELERQLEKVLATKGDVALGR